jgi:hypothetical protein
MRLQAIALTIHILGLIAVFGAFVIQHRVLARLRRAATREEALPWAELLAATAPMMPSGAIMLLLTGGYMSKAWMPLHPAWIFVSMATVAFIGGVGFFLMGPFRRARRAAEGTGPLASGFPLSRAGGILHAAANGAALGTIWLMTAKPGWTESVIAAALPAVIGACVGARISEKKP